MKKSRLNIGFHSRSADSGRNAKQLHLGFNHVGFIIAFAETRITGKSGNMFARIPSERVWWKILKIGLIKV
jgi:hypothetical protein